MLEHNDELYELMKRIFFGEVPEHFHFFLNSEGLARFIENKNKIPARNVNGINYVDFILEFGGAIMPEIRQQPNLPQIDPADFQDDIRTFVVTLYLGFIQNPKNTPQTKINLGIFIRKYLETIKAIWNKDIMADQSGFFDIITKNEKELLKELEQYQILQNAVTFVPNISEHWNYTEIQLSELSEALCRAGFTETTQDFYQAFSKSLIKSCNWKMKKTAFLFLWHLIFEKATIIPEKTIPFIIERFLFKGKLTNPHNLRTQFTQIKRNFTTNPDDLGNQFLLIYRIYSTVLKEE